MKKLVFFALALLAITVTTVFAQGKAERYADSPAENVDGFAPRSISLYPHTKASVTVPLVATGATAVTKYCAFSTKALTVQINGAGDARTIPANTDYCRTVRRGVTSLVFGGASSASTNIQIERQY